MTRHIPRFRLLEAVNPPPEGKGLICRPGSENYISRQCLFKLLATFPSMCLYQGGTPGKLDWLM